MLEWIDVSLGIRVQSLRREFSSLYHFELARGNLQHIQDSYLFPS
jgi:hypothetical protein